jgi:hypothetical protein
MYFLCFIFSKVEIIPIQNKTIKHTYLKVCKERESAFYPTFTNQNILFSS